MIHRAPAGAQRSGYDLCIIGSGPAGLTVANEIASSGARASICVLESGSDRATPFADRLREVDSLGIPIRPSSRERVLGGASSTWTGVSSVLDEIDFQPRPAVPFSGWPIRGAELRPYYRRAAERYRFPPPALFAPAEPDPAGRDRIFRPCWEELEEKAFVIAREPQRFGRDFAGLAERPEVDLHLETTVVRLEGDRQTGRARAAVARSPDGRELRVEADFFVLAAGAIENARLLLLSTYACPQGLGNERDQVGRYLMNHPKGYLGAILLDPSPRRLGRYLGAPCGDGFVRYVGLRLSEALQRREGLLNCYVRLEPHEDWAPRAEPGISLEAVTSSLGRYARRARHQLVWRSKRGGLPCIRLRNFMEMQPDPGNRVTLASRRDAHGTALPRVRHRVSELDRRSMQRVHEALRREVRRVGWGRLVSDLTADLEPWPIGLDASHHLGTTRMGHDPATSVADPDCRLHEVPNVYLAGGSVFPTSGNANPTLTIVALAIRLADHLAGRIGEASGSPV